MLRISITAAADPKKCVWRDMSCPPSANMFMIRAPALEGRKSAGRAQKDAIAPKARSLQQLERNRNSNIKFEFT
jgi:hypothetical protein